ncbi:hypothetical protein CGBL_0102510 [Corynebacterium glutamicum]|nr:hypothetical protein CGBL_0102510 [Corynebacterium glutamicum]
MPPKHRPNALRFHPPPRMLPFELRHLFHQLNDLPRRIIHTIIRKPQRHMALYHGFIALPAINDEIPPIRLVILPAIHINQRHTHHLNIPPIPLHHHILPGPKPSIPQLLHHHLLQTTVQTIDTLLQKLPQLRLPPRSQQLQIMRHLLHPAPRLIPLLH